MAGEGGGERHETELERADRNFTELLQELRVAQTGVQILFAFLLTIPFAQGFAGVDTFRRLVYVGTLLACAGATALLVAPVSFHRIVFRKHHKRELVAATNVLAQGGLALLALSLVGSLLLVVDVVLGRPAGLLLAGATALLFVLLWYVLPLRSLARWRRRP